MGIGLMMLMGLMRLVGSDVVFLASAGLASKAASSSDEPLPSLPVERGYVFLHDAFPDEGAGKAGIEAVARPYRADNIVDWRCLKVVAARRSTYRDAFRTCCANEVSTMLAYIPIIYNARVARGKHDVEVVGAAADDGALAEVLLYDWRQ